MHFEFRIRATTSIAEARRCEVRTSLWMNNCCGLTSSHSNH
ncbi:Protein of unknown function [Pyronema omphalodes CBS 100304]|uniref:Uncharacterized protein n=1 Tax=Pyronema omphalodes (strain CBS 100304) TaxID=1076935 RepID=U4KYR1_PYROM|nr:Protein of unknown function [Pyronema omphalodes CBS 100304]